MECIKKWAVFKKSCPQACQTNQRSGGKKKDAVISNVNEIPVDDNGNLDVEESREVLITADVQDLIWNTFILILISKT